MFTEEQKAALSAKLDMKRVKSRKQGKSRVNFIEAWDAIDTANRIFGFDGWDSEIVSLTKAAEWQSKSRNGRPLFNVCFLCRVRVTVRAGDVLVSKEGAGGDSAMSPAASPGEAYENAAKGAESDAIKRALAKFGNQFGLALYDEEKKGVAGRNEPSLEDAKSAADSMHEWMRKAQDVDALRRVWEEGKPMRAVIAAFSDRMYEDLRDAFAKRGEELKAAAAAAEAEEDETLDDDIPF